MPAEVNFLNITMYDNNYYGGTALIFGMAGSFVFEDALITNTCFDCALEERLEAAFIVDRILKDESENCNLLFENIDFVSNSGGVSSFVYVRENAVDVEEEPNTLVIQSSHFERNSGEEGITLTSNDAYEIYIDGITTVNNTCPICNN